MKNLQLQFSRDNEHYVFHHKLLDGKWRIPHNLENAPDAEIVIGDRTIPISAILSGNEFFEEKYPGINHYIGKVELDKNLVFPDFSYSDVTEKILFGFSEIEKTFIDEGIWANYGDRTFKAVFPRYAEILRQDGFGDLKLSYSLLVKSAENENFNKLIATNVTDNLESNEEDLVVKFTVDTEALSEMMNDGMHKVLFELEFQMTLGFAEEESYILSFPIYLTLLNPEKLTKKNTVAIDFGTSSTCVAYRKKAKPTLLSLQDDLSSFAAFENPTNLMVNDWEAFRKEWSSRTNGLPLLVKNALEFEDVYHFDQGHQLRQGMRDATPNMLKATMDELKLVPYRRMKLDKQDYFVPAKTSKNGARQIHLVCSPEEENDESIDPIAFYGYLLGRAINRPFNTEIPLEYYITVPVKFDVNVREAIRKSLEFGVKLSLPKTVQEMANVRIGNEEPVAFIRAVIGNQVIQNSGWTPGSEMPFAVFDFGGGTLDFSFGVYREANDEEIDDHDNIIEIFRTSGHEEGGAEHLIHWLSYEIYKGNKDIMRANEICFPKPMNADEIEFFPEKLLRESPLALTNLRYINEFCSRPLFRGEKVNSSVPLELYNIDGDTVPIDLLVNYDELVDNLKLALEKMVASFEDELKIAFQNNPNYLEELHIFRAGNASRSVMITELLEEYFEEIKDKDRIHFIEEESVHGVKPKTAVALGQLSLATDQSIGVVMSNTNQKSTVPFMFNVGVINANDDNRFDVKISINSLEKTWQNLGRYNKETMTYTVYYTNAPNVKNLDDNRLRTHDHVLKEDEAQQGTFLWARSVEENVIEYVLMKARQDPEVSLEGKKIYLPRG